MEEYFNKLFNELPTWRIQSFLDRMQDFKKQCSTNQEEDYIRQGIFAAQTELISREMSK